MPDAYAAMDSVLVSQGDQFAQQQAASIQIGESLKLHKAHKVVAEPRYVVCAVTTEQNDNDAWLRQRFSSVPFLGSLTEHDDTGYICVTHRTGM